MRIPKTKVLLPVIFLVIIGLILAVYYLYFKQPQGYYAVVTSGLCIQKGDPVYFQQEKGGEVQEVITSGSDAIGHIIRFSLLRDYSIPVNSRINVVCGEEGDNGHIAIEVEASRDYFQPGDTVFRGNPVFLPLASDPGESAQKNLSGDKLVYKIQLMVSAGKIEINDENFKGISEIEVIEADGLFKYYTGNLGTLAEARELRNQVVDAGIRDAFIVPFLGERRISIEEAGVYE